MGLRLAALRAAGAPLLLEYGRHVARLHRRRRRRRRRRRAYAPTSNTASHGTHEEINSWVSFSSLIWVWGSAWRPLAAGAPLLTAILACLIRLQLSKHISVPCFESLDILDLFLTY